MAHEEVKAYQASRQGQRHIARRHKYLHPPANVINADGRGCKGCKAVNIPAICIISDYLLIPQTSPCFIEFPIGTHDKLAGAEMRRNNKGTDDGRAAATEPGVMVYVPATPAGRDKIARVSV